MGSVVAPEKRRFRPFVIVTMPILFLACVAGAVWVLIATREAMLASPFVVIAIGPTRMIRWTMLWLSTPEERKLLAPGLEREPIVGLIKRLFNSEKK